MIYIVTLLGLAILAFVISCIYKKKDISRIVILSIVGYVFSFIINSAILFYINRFSVLLTCVLILIEAVLFAVALLFMGKRPTYSFKMLDCVIPLVIFLIIFPVVFLKFGFFGMGQDEGVYQVKAIALIEGYNDDEYELEETRSLNKEQLQQYRDGIEEQYGYYYMLDDTNITKGVFHGVNTYPAVLAWWGDMFGIRHMTDVNTVMFLCGIFLIYDIARRFLSKRTGATAVTFLYAVSPIVLWVNKSTLSEAVTNLVFLAFIYTLFEREHKQLVWISAIPVVVYAVFHVSIYVMMPMFVAVFIAMYLITGNKQYMVANIIGAIGYRLGYVYMIHVAEDYTQGNYAFVERLGINENRMPAVATIAVCVVIAISILLMFVPVKRDEKKTVFDIRWVQVVIAWAGRFMVIGCALYAYKMIHYSVFSYVNSTMYAYVAATVIIAIPFILFLIFFRAKLVFQNTMLVPLYIIFLYCGILYATVLSPIVAYYNYYSRYISVYLCCVLLFGACLLEQLFVKVHNKNILNYIYGALIVLAVVLYGRYDFFMIQNKDETRVQWNMVEEVSNQLKPSDSLIIDGDLKNQLFFTTKMLSGNKAYPVMNSLNDTLAIAGKQSDNIYYATYNRLGETQAENNHMDLVSVIDNSEEIYNKDRVDLGKLPYVDISYQYQKPVYLYKSTSQSK